MLLVVILMLSLPWENRHVIFYSSLPRINLILLIWPERFNYKIVKWDERKLSINLGRILFLYRKCMHFLFTFFLSFLVWKMWQKMKTHVINSNCNPVWNCDLTLPIRDPNLPVHLVSDLLFFEYFWSIASHSTQQGTHVITFN